MTSRLPRLVRARPKKVEDLPEWAKCCEKCAEDCAAGGEMVLDLNRQLLRPVRPCCFCGVPFPKPWMAAPDVKDDSYVALELVDLDEGPLETSGQ